MDENKNALSEEKALIEEYDKHRRKVVRIVLFVCIIVLGATCIISAFLFRTQYPFSVEDKGQIHYTYSHVLMRDKTKYNMFGKIKSRDVKYYVVYRNASIYYEQETTFVTYAAHAKKENVEPGITNHAVIQTAVDRYTYLARDGSTYCYEEHVGKLKVLFDAAFGEGEFYFRLAGYVCGAVLICIGSIFLHKQRKKSKTETES
ncbi:MAG: hypothetical protein IKE65_09035 [Clostridia bacterium]|nr:hypothetical protein [Clostridia bacterium]